VRKQERKRQWKGKWKYFLFEDLKGKKPKERIVTEDLLEKQELQAQHWYEMDLKRRPHGLDETVASSFDATNVHFSDQCGRCREGQRNYYKYSPPPSEQPGTAHTHTIRRVLFVFGGDLAWLATCVGIQKGGKHCCPMCTVAHPGRGTNTDLCSGVPHGLFTYAKYLAYDQGRTKAHTRRTSALAAQNFKKYTETVLAKPVKTRKRKAAVEEKKDEKQTKAGKKAKIAKDERAKKKQAKGCPLRDQAAQPVQRAVHDRRNRTSCCSSTSARRPGSDQVVD
jgi:hypothetical protein